MAGGKGSKGPIKAPRYIDPDQCFPERYTANCDVCSDKVKAPCPSPAFSGIPCAVCAKRGLPCTWREPKVASTNVQKAERLLAEQREALSADVDSGSSNLPTPKPSASKPSAQHHPSLKVPASSSSRPRAAPVVIPGLTIGNIPDAIASSSTPIPKPAPALPKPSNNFDFFADTDASPRPHHKKPKLAASGSTPAVGGGETPRSVKGERDLERGAHRGGGGEGKGKERDPEGRKRDSFREERRDSGSRVERENNRGEHRDRDRDRNRDSGRDRDRDRPKHRDSLLHQQNPPTPRRAQPPSSPGGASNASSGLSTPPPSQPSQIPLVSTFQGFKRDEVDEDAVEGGLPSPSVPAPRRASGAARHDSFDGAQSLGHGHGHGHAAAGKKGRVRIMDSDEEDEGDDDRMDVDEPGPSSQSQTESKPLDQPPKKARFQEDGHAEEGQREKKKDKGKGKRVRQADEDDRAGDLGGGSEERESKRPRREQKKPRGMDQFDTGDGEDEAEDGMDLNSMVGQETSQARKDMEEHGDGLGRGAASAKSGLKIKLKVNAAKVEDGEEGARSEIESNRPKQDESEPRPTKKKNRPDLDDARSRPGEVTDSDIEKPLRTAKSTAITPGSRLDDHSHGMDSPAGPNLQRAKIPHAKAIGAATGGGGMSGKSTPTGAAVPRPKKAAAVDPILAALGMGGAGSSLTAAKPAANKPIQSQASKNIYKSRPSVNATFSGSAIAPSVKATIDLMGISKTIMDYRTQANARYEIPGSEPKRVAGFMTKFREMRSAGKFEGALVV